MTRFRLIEEVIEDRRSNLVTMGMGPNQNLVTIGYTGILVKVVQKIIKGGGSRPPSAKILKQKPEEIEICYIVRAKLLKVNNLTDFEMIEGEIKRCFDAAIDMSIKAKKTEQQSSNPNIKVSAKITKNK